MKMSLSRRVGAEFIGTFWLVLVGCGSAVLAGRLFQTWDRFHRGGLGLRAYAAHHGVRDRPYFGMSYQSCGQLWRSGRPKRR
jgi:hypothetical protein